MIICSVLLVWCGKKDAPTVTQLPTQVIKQDIEPTDDTQWDDSWSELQDNDQQVDTTRNQKQEVFDPNEFEAENDEIQQLVDILEELIQEQEE